MRGGRLAYLYLGSADVSRDLAFDLEQFPLGKQRNVPVHGGLRDVGQATTQLSAIAAQLEREFPETNRGFSAGALPYTETLFRREIYAMLFTMLGAGIGVLLIACVNVSNLLVARASLRRREVAVRMALGAARGRIIRQHLTEVLVLACTGAVLGILLSVVGVRWFTATLSANPPPFWKSWSTVVVGWPRLAAPPWALYSASISRLGYRCVDPNQSVK